MARVSKNLTQAVRWGDREALVRLLDEGHDPNRRYRPKLRFNHDESPLRAAIQCHDVEAVTLLLNRGARVEGVDVEPALATALGLGHLDLVQVLLAAGACPHIRYKQLNGSNGLLMALVERAPYSAIRWLLDQGVPVDGTEPRMWTPLRQGVSNPRGFLERDAQGQPTERQDYWRSLMALIEAGADVNHRPHRPYMTSILHQAIAHTDVEVVQALLQAGADPNAPGHLSPDKPSVPPLGLAIPRSAAMVRVLLDAGANPHTLIDFNDRTESGQPNAVATAHMQDQEPKRRHFRATWLMYAAVYGHPGTVELLLAAGVPPDATDSRGFTALHHAVHRRSQGFPCLRNLQALLAADVSVDRCNDRGQTALHRLVAHRLAQVYQPPDEALAETLQCFIEAGADVTIPDNEGPAAMESLGAVMARAEYAGCHQAEAELAQHMLRVLQAGLSQRELTANLAQASSGRRARRM